MAHAGAGDPLSRRASGVGDVRARCSSGTRSRSWPKSDELRLRASGSWPSPPSRHRTDGPGIRVSMPSGVGPEGRARLRRLLDAQIYRLVHWRRAARELNYGRFFDVNELVAAAYGRSRGLRPDSCARAGMAPPWLDRRIPYRPSRWPTGSLRLPPVRLAAAARDAEEAPAIFVRKNLDVGRAPARRVAGIRHDRLRFF